MNKKSIYSVIFLLIGLFVSKVPLFPFVFFAISVKLSMDAKREIQKSGEKGLALTRIVEIISAICVAFGIFLFLSSFLIGISID